MSRECKEKWAVYGEYGGNFTNLKGARLCAKEASKTQEHDYEANVTLIADGCTYIDYKNGKCTRDGWTIKRK